MVRSLFDYCCPVFAYLRIEIFAEKTLVLGAKLDKFITSVSVCRISFFDNSICRPLLIALHMYSTCTRRLQIHLITQTLMTYSIHAFLC